MKIWMHSGEKCWRAKDSRAGVTRALHKRVKDVSAPGEIVRETRDGIHIEPQLSGPDATISPKSDSSLKEDEAVSTILNSAGLNNTLLELVSVKDIN